MLNRRIFLKSAIISPIFLNFAFATEPEDAHHIGILTAAAGNLFPFKSDAKKYFQIILNHSKISSETKNYLKNGASSLDALAQNEHKHGFLHLPAATQAAVLAAAIDTTQWGQDWAAAVMTYAAESALAAPIYGSNDGSLAAAIHHTPGWPEPKRPYL